MGDSKIIESDTIDFDWSTELKPDYLDRRYELDDVYFKPSKHILDKLCKDRFYLQPLEYQNNQEDAITKFNDIGCVFLSASDIYHIFDIWMNKMQNFKVGKNTEQIYQKSKIIRESFYGTLLTSTRISHQRKENKAIISHYYKSEVVQAIEKDVEMPNYGRINIDEILGFKKGKELIQTIFQTRDSESQIMRNLEFMSQESIENIYVNTGKFTKKMVKPRKAVSFIKSYIFEISLSEDTYKLGESYGI